MTPRPRPRPGEPVAYTPLFAEPVLDPNAIAKAFVLLFGDELRERLRLRNAGREPPARHAPAPPSS